MSSDISALIDHISSCKSLEDLKTIEHVLFSRKSGLLTLAFKQLNTLSPKEKKIKAKELNALKKRAQETGNGMREALKKRVTDAAEHNVLDITLDLPEEEHGHLHLIPEYIAQVEDVFGRLGFDVAYGNEIETEETNFDLLNFPKDHPARDSQGIFYLCNKERGTQSAQQPLLRAHTSPVQIHYMRTHTPPLRMICPGKVYRKDADATHSPMFHQFEALMIDTDISLAHMKSIMETAMRELMGSDVEFRWRTGYFPFVEPGLEVDVRWRGAGWLEIAGCGMVHPNVLEHCDIDPKKWQGFAFGFGIERMLMIKHHIPDIRLFTEGDLRFLRQF
ncbi:phenylalanine--tRNA ligase subunit alpha [Candidatus Peribacteria bacterium RIFCSPHIGHO2_02_FULL_49_16]|nr:MAG: phenylalanine--tRNA ligase subunit alpha [Candidatus Peribacteria bacterium RIFCSPHIGHO2_01_FULL_49_38]OGJ59742.1 MAG: phenylalanine--tRNA ligase subunit alpha [Candidatus Peribacteria bacterium RIFCSPHIGHO2_02_FULL_49_16]